MKKILLFFIWSLLLLSCEKNSVTRTHGDCVNGFGLKIYEDGGYEYGKWENGLLDGRGEQFFGNTSKFSGDKFIGEFKNGRFHGQGVYIDISEAIEFDGLWQNGRPLKGDTTAFNPYIKRIFDSEDHKWISIRDEKLKFKIKYPKIDTLSVMEKITTHENTQLGDFTSHSFLLNCQNSNHVNYAYNLTINKYESEKLNDYRGNNLSTFYDELEEMLEELTGTRSLQRRTVDISGQEGREFWLIKDAYNQRLKIHSVLIDSTEYRLIVVAPDKDFFNPFISEFMNSFEIMD